jgi:hypothetical protein
MLYVEKTCPRNLSSNMINMYYKYKIKNPCMKLWCIIDSRVEECATKMVIEFMAIVISGFSNWSTKASLTYRKHGIIPMHWQIVLPCGDKIVNSKCKVWNACLSCCCMIWHFCWYIYGVWILHINFQGLSVVATKLPLSLSISL